MGILSNQFADVIEWTQYNEETLFWKWPETEIKKGSRLVIRQGQDAVFMYNGKVEGIFEDEGSYEVDTDIIPFLSTLKGFKFGFKSGLKAEVLFVNTKEVLVKWGTKNAINIPTAELKGGMPIRAFGTFTVKISDHDLLIDKVAGIKNIFTVSDVKERVVSQLDQLLMKWIASEGKDIFNIQANSIQISEGIREDLDYEMRKIGIAVTSFAISSVTYPEEIQNMVQKVAGQSMVDDVGKYQQVALGDAIAEGKDGGAAATAATIAAGLQMGSNLVNNASQGGNNAYNGNGSAPQGALNFCPNCGVKIIPGNNFCANCGQKLSLD